MSFLTSIFASGEQERSDDLDARLDALNRRKLEEGKISPTEYDRRAAVLAENRTDVDAEVSAAFKEGAQEGYNNVTGAIKDAAAAPFRFAWDIIPWQLIVAALIVAFFYMGGASLLKGVLKK